MKILGAMCINAEALQKNAQDAEALQRLGEEDQLFHRTLFDIVKNGFLQDRFERTEILQRMTMPARRLKPPSYVECLVPNGIMEMRALILNAILTQPIHC